MSNRTLIKVSASENCIGFKTVSRRRKASRVFLVTRNELARLEQEREVITRDIWSFAILRRDVDAGTLSINFSWLQSSCGSLAGWEETFTLPYDALTGFVEASAREDGPKGWKVLSLQRPMTPQIEFYHRDRLHECLENKIVRGKLARALRDSFHGADRVVLYRDFVEYSFVFQSFRAGRSIITGGLIFHNQGDLKKAQYSVHT